MSMLKKNQLMLAYLNTIYIFNGIEFSPLEENAKLKKYLKHYNITNWAFITSDNPFSEQISDEENSKRRLKFRNNLIDKGLKFCDAEGADPKREWPSEYGFFIENISKVDAVKLGNKYGQNAILFGDDSGEAEVMWIKKPILQINEEKLERILAREVVGCIHRFHSTTGCPGREAAALKKLGMTATKGREIIGKWRAEGGVPEKYLENFENYHHRDLDYKEMVLKVLERMSKRGAA